MAFIPIPNVAQVRIVWATTATFVAENTVYFLNNADVPWSSSLLESIGAEFASSLGGMATLPYSNNVAPTQLHMRDLSEEAGAVFDYTFLSPEFGSSSTALLPSNATIAVKFSTGLAGRSYRGRVYHPALTEGMVTLNALASGEGSNILTFWETLMTDIAAGVDATHVVASRFNGGAPRVTGVATPVISYTLTDVKIDSQRRRLKHY